MSTAALPRRDVITLGPLQILPADRMAQAAGRTLALSGREIALLIELAFRAGRIIERNELSQLAWGRELRAGDRSVDVYVRRLRVKLERALPEWRFIHTHFGFGYRLAPEQIHDKGQIAGASTRW